MIGIQDSCILNYMMVSLLCKCLSDSYYVIGIKGQNSTF